MIALKVPQNHQISALDLLDLAVSNQQAQIIDLLCYVAILLVLVCALFWPWPRTGSEVGVQWVCGWESLAAMGGALKRAGVIVTKCKRPISSK